MCFNLSFKRWHRWGEVDIQWWRLPGQTTGAWHWKDRAPALFRMTRGRLQETLPLTHVYCEGHRPIHKGRWWGGGGVWTSQCSHLSVVVGNMYTFVWLLLSSSVHTTRYNIKALSIYILDNVWRGAKELRSQWDHNKHDPDIFNCYTINIHLRTWIHCASSSSLCFKA